MENKRNSLLLISTIIGAIFVIAVVVFCVFAFKDLPKSEVDFFTGTKNLFNSVIAGDLGFGGNIFLGIIIIIPIAFIFNVIGWLKNIKIFVLIGGILYILCFNLLSAPLCFIEYFGLKERIKNKLLFYVMLYTFIFSIVFIILWANFSSVDSFTTYSTIYMCITTSIGLVSNFIAWKKDVKIIKHITGIIYVFGIFTIIPGILCFISFGKDKGNDKIKNKLLFYTMLYTLFFNILLIIMTVSLGNDNLPIYFCLAANIGLIVNFIAWKTDIRILKLIAGIIYIFGVFTIISAIPCIISFGIHKKQNIQVAQ